VLCQAKAPFSVSSALTNISSVAAVQQADFAATVGVLAGTVAADIEQQSDGMDSRELQRGLFQTQVTMSSPYRTAPGLHKELGVTSEYFHR
jgi:hypothetical protein